MELKRRPDFPTEAEIHADLLQRLLRARVEVRVKQMIERLSEMGSGQPIVVDEIPCVYESVVRESNRE